MASDLAREFAVRRAGDGDIVTLVHAKYDELLDHLCHASAGRLSDVQDVLAFGGTHRVLAEIMKGTEWVDCAADLAALRPEATSTSAKYTHT